jgi:protein TonB
MLVATASLPVLNHPAPPAPNLVPGALMKQVMPTYPEIARHAGIAGSVTIKALIQKDGSIGAVTVMSGHPLLRSAAVAAVRQWRYRPFYLNGEPVTAETNITLNFKP